MAACLYGIVLARSLERTFRKEGQSLELARFLFFELVTF
jgi:hypothetical protein